MTDEATCAIPACSRPRQEGRMFCAKHGTPTETSRASGSAGHSPKTIVTSLAVLAFIIIFAVVALQGGHHHKGSGSSSAGGDGGGDTVTTTSSDPLDEPSTATCQDWLDATQSDRDDTAQRLAVALKAFDQSMTFAHEFAVDISKDCSAAPSLGLKDVVAALATLDTADFGN